MRPFCSHTIPITGHTVTEAEQDLQAIHPDGGDTCLCKNNISQPLRYDLQIIVPAYNAAQHIAECMDSILAQQTKYTFAITVVNDGSTDNTLQLLQRYTIHPNVILFDQENRGFSGARNRALEELIAKYVLFVDADDRLLPGAIESLMHTAEREQADIVEGGYRHFDDNKTIYTSCHQVQVTADWSILHGYPWGKVYRSTLFSQVHFPRNYWFEDTVCIYMLYPQCRHIAVISNIIYEYRANKSGITSTSRGDVHTIDALWVTRHILSDAQKYGIAWEQTLYESFLKDLCTNYARFATLKHPTAHRNAFIISCALREQHFSRFRTNDPKLKPLESALLTGDYGAYMLYGRCYL